MTRREVETGVSKAKVGEVLKHRGRGGVLKVFHNSFSRNVKAWAHVLHSSKYVGNKKRAARQSSGWGGTDKGMPVPSITVKFKGTDRR